MKSLTIAELSKLTFKESKMSKNAGLYAALAQLQVDESLLVNTGDWRGTSPFTVNRNLQFSKNKRFKVRTLANDVGWVVTRTA